MIIATLYIVTTKLTLDESVMCGSGHIFWQYLSNKRCIYGINFYDLCTHDGIVFKMVIYARVGLLDKYNIGQKKAIFLKHRRKKYPDKV